MTKTLFKNYERLISRHTFTRKTNPITGAAEEDDELVALYCNQRPRRNPSLIYLIRPETLLDWLCRYNGSPNLWLHPERGPMDVYYLPTKERRSVLFCRYLLGCEKGQSARPLAFREPKPDFAKTRAELGRKGQARLYNARSDRINASLRDLRPEHWEILPSKNRSRSVSDQLREYRSIREPTTERQLADALVPVERIEDETAWTAYL